LAKAANEKQMKSVGNQRGGRVFLFLCTDYFQRDYDRMLKKGIRFVRPPKEEPYGRSQFSKTCTGICGIRWNPIKITRGLYEIS